MQGLLRGGGCADGSAGRRRTVVVEARRLLHRRSRHRFPGLGSRYLAGPSLTPVRARSFRDRRSCLLLGALQLPARCRRCLSRARVRCRAASSPARSRGAPLPSRRASSRVGVRTPKPSIHEQRFRSRIQRADTIAPHERIEVAAGQARSTKCFSLSWGAGEHASSDSTSLARGVAHHPRTQPTKVVMPPKRADSRRHRGQPCYDSSPLERSKWHPDFSAQATSKRLGFLH